MKATQIKAACAVLIASSLVGIGTMLATSGRSEARSTQGQSDVQTSPQLPMPHPACTTTAGDFEGFNMETSGTNPVLAEVEMTFDTSGRQVHLNFSYCEGDFPDYNIASEATAVPTSYYPTSAIYIGDEQVAIAGMDVMTGLAVVEVWELSKPTLYRFPSSTGSIDQLFLRGGRVTKVRTGFAPPADSGFGLVKAMWRNRRLGSDHIFVLTCVGRDVYSIDLATKSATLVFSNDSPVGALAPVPALSDEWRGYLGPNNHPLLGDVYALVRNQDFSHGDVDDIHSLYMIDSDLNGSIDSAIEVSESIEESLGIGDGSLWEFGWQ